MKILNDFNPKPYFYGQYQRQPLKHNPNKRLQSSRSIRKIGHRRMQPSNTHILLTHTLLQFHESRGSINAHNQVTTYIRVESTTWPVLSTQRTHLIKARTSCVKGFTALSRLRIPYLIYSVWGHLRGEKHTKNECSDQYVH